MNLGSESSFNHLYKILNNKDRYKDQQLDKIHHTQSHKPKINFLYAKLIKFVIFLC